MASLQDIANRWADVQVGRESRYLGTTRSGNLYVSGDKLYSYGSHFELARFVRPADTDNAAPFFLLNGDTYSVSTARHQRYTRAAVDRHALYPSIIIPHSALVSAGIELGSIVPVDIEPERNEKNTHRVTVPELVTRGNLCAAGTFGWDRSGHDADKERGTYALSISRDVVADDGTRYSVTACKRDYDHAARAFVDYDTPSIRYYRNGAELRHIEGDTFEYDTWRHFLGASVFAANVTDYVYTPCKAHTDNGRGYCDSCGYNVAGHGPGRYSDRTPMRETKRTRRAYFLSAFDTNEAHAHYFLCELPAVWDDPARTPVVPVSVADAYRYLMPAIVRDAASRGTDAKRQGDIFAVSADDVAARFPIAFRYAERNGSIPLDGSGRHVASELVTLTSADGKTVRYFARGRIVHASGRRSWTGRLVGREHATLKLGNVWHELARNLVPMTAPNVSTDARGRYPSGAHVRAWSIIGNVD